MTKEETVKILAVIKAEYGLHFKNMSAIDANAKVNLWAELFEDKEYKLVSAAVMAYIANDTTGHPPKPGQINELIRKLTQSEQMTEQEALNLILKAASNSNYNAQAEFDKLPPVLQRLCGSPSQLRAWGMMNTDELQTVVTSNLMRSYRAIAKNEETRQNLPSSIQNLIGNLAEQLKLE